MKNHHHREAYELHLKKLMKETNDEVPELSLLSNRSLLFRINYFLIQNNCLPFSESDIRKLEVKIK